MAHSCPYCNSTCHCRGDIDDREFDEAKDKYCLHDCGEDEFDYEETMQNEDDY